MRPLGGAGLAGFEQEPLPGRPLLFDFEAVVVTYSYGSGNALADENRRHQMPERIAPMPR